MNEWFLVQAKPSADHIAKRLLVRQGFVPFQRMKQRSVARNGADVLQFRPACPGYAFLSYPGEVASSSLISSTCGVARLVSYGHRPAPVAAQVMAELRAACERSDVIVMGRRVVPGTHVEVRHDTLASLLGKVERLALSHRVREHSDFLSKRTKGLVPAAHIQAPSSPVSVIGATT